jgi:hypothetical protein
VVACAAAAAGCASRLMPMRHAKARRLQAETARKGVFSGNGGTSSLLLRSAMQVQAAGDTG